MTTVEFSTEMDIIYENINKNGAPGLDEYEKSVILTHAQEVLVNTVLQAEPDSSRFPELITVVNNTTSSQTGFEGIGSYVYTLPDNIVKVLNESITDDESISYTVLPITNIQYQSKKAKPYQYPPRRRAWRLGLENPIGEASAEIVARSGVTPASYNLRYVRKPTPIILEDLATAVPPASIDGLTAITECELSKGLQREILKLATTLAEQYYYDKYGTDGNK